MVHEFPRGLSEFYRVLYEILDDSSLDPVISWSKTNKSFVIWNVDGLTHRKILRRFYCCKFAELLSELKEYGFVRIKKNKKQWEFGHKEYLVRGKPELLKKLQTENLMRKMRKIDREMKAEAEVGEAMQLLQI